MYTIEGDDAELMVVAHGQGDNWQLNGAPGYGPGLTAPDSEKLEASNAR